MNEKYSPLFTPWKIGNCEIKNRIVQVSMGGTSLFGWLEPCHFDKEAAYHILNRAQNNVGLVLPGMQCVRDTMGIPGRHWLYQNKRMFRELAEWMPEFHKTGAKLFIQLIVLFLGFLQLLLVNAHIGAGFRVAAVQGDAVLDIDTVARFPFFDGFHIVADFSLQADICNQTVSGFGIDPGHVAGIRVTVGITVLYVKENNKFIPIFDCFHNY